MRYLQQPLRVVDRAPTYQREHTRRRRKLGWRDREDVLRQHRFAGLKAMLPEAIEAPVGYTFPIDKLLGPRLLSNHHVRGVAQWAHQAVFFRALLMS